MVNPKFAAVAAVALSFTGCAHGQPAKETFVFFGQDLGSLRDYFGKSCPADVDGATAYINLYSLLSPEQNFGGLGVDAHLHPLAHNADWGAGPSSAWLTAKEFGCANLALGVSLTEDFAVGGLHKVAQGRYDAEIRQLAAFVRAVNRPVFLRLGYEFDGVWNKGYQDHEAYKEAWRHIIDLMRKEGASKAVFVWQASASPIDDVLDGRRDAIGTWYPGDAYVDWVAISWFLHPDKKGAAVLGVEGIPTQRILADEVLDFAKAHSKHVMIAELSPQGYDLAVGSVANISPIWDGPSGEGRERRTPQQIWSDWYAPLFDYLSAHRDTIRAIAYINANWDQQKMWGPPYRNGYWGDTRLQASPEIASRWRAAIVAWRAGGVPSRAKERRRETPFTVPEATPRN